MADIHCSAIVHWQSGVILVRDKPTAKWRLPDRELHQDEGPILCIRRCVLLETGYRAQLLRLFKIEAHGSDPKRTVRFIFGCQIEPAQIHQPEAEVASFTPAEVLKLAQNEAFDDPVLLKIIHNFENLLPTPLFEGAEPPYLD